MRRTWRWMTLSVVLAIACSSLSLGEGNSEPPKPAEGLTLARDTTVVTQLLLPDGTPDYVDYVNRKAARGVTPDTNAAVLLLQALGPEIIPPAVLDESLRRLGLDGVPEGKRFQTLEAFLTARGGGRDAQALADLAAKQSDRAILGPWKPTDLPDLHAWLQANQEPLDALAAGSKRPRYYLPLLAADPAMSLAGETPTKPWLGLRAAVEALMARSNRSFAAGETAKGVEDLLTGLRMAVLVAQGPSLVEQMVGTSVQRTVAEQVSGLAAAGLLTAEQAKGLLAGMNALPPPPSPVKAVDGTERLRVLSQILFCRRVGLGPGGDWLQSSLDDPTLPPPPSEARPDLSIDWNLILRTMNGWFDQQVQAMSVEDPVERRGKVDRCIEEYWKLKKSVADTCQPLGEAGLAKLLGHTDTPRSLDENKLLADMVVAMLYPILYPPLEKTVAHHGSARAAFELARVTLALELWRAAHKEYPADLSVLAPGLLPAVPADPFSGQPFRYRRVKAGYALYSLGADLDDDGGNREKKRGKTVDGDIVIEGDGG